MLFHTRFVLATLFGTSVRWNAQQRTANGTGWTDALREHWRHTLLGVGWGAFVWEIEPKAFWWMLPVFSGMILSIPLSVLTSRESLGSMFRRAGLFVTPEETCPPLELASLDQLEMSGRSALKPARHVPPGIEEVVFDPYVNAIHVSLLREKRHHPKYTEELDAAGIQGEPDHALGERLLKEGPASLEPSEQMSILANADLTVWLHRELWRRPTQQLAPAWRVIVNPEFT
jgi:membrane glycosyltransferase